MSESKSIILHIDRIVPVSFKDIGAELLTIDGLSIIWEDARSIALSAIDMSRVCLKLIIETEEAHPVDANTLLARNITLLQKEGYILLDAKVLETLLLHPENITKEWYTVADSDTVEQSSIEFRGTVLNKGVSAEEIIFTLSYARGYWHYGWSNTFYDAQDLESFSKDSWAPLRRHVAVLKPA